MSGTPPETGAGRTPRPAPPRRAATGRNYAVTRLLRRRFVTAGEFELGELGVGPQPDGSANVDRHPLPIHAVLLVGDDRVFVALSGDARNKDERFPVTRRDQPFVSVALLLQRLFDVIGRYLTALRRGLFVRGRELADMLGRLDRDRVVRRRRLLAASGDNGGTNYSETRNEQGTDHRVSCGKGVGKCNLAGG